MYQTQIQFYNWSKNSSNCNPIKDLQPYISEEDIMEFDEEYKKRIMIQRRIMSKRGLSLSNLIKR